MSNSTFNFNAFIKESADVLKDPKTYFSTMKTTGGIAEPLIKAVIYGAIAGIIIFIWSLFKFGGASLGLMGGVSGIMAIIWYIVGAIIALFIGAVILLVISAICKGSTDFESNIRVTAAAMVMMPISALFGFITGLSITLGTIVGLAVSLYGLYLLYHGLTQTLKADAGTAKIVVIILAVLLVLFTIIGIGARKRASKFMEDFNKEDLKERIENSMQN
ncbi:MAG: hypothetical protein H6Q23_2129 [Bacteroidetes bacterium]|jgi:hypothetical protein|nr:hypothetical protein [Bacteroidota bacterium]